jgi:hypothetical protein
MMIRINEMPEDSRQYIKRPIPIRAVQINEPFLIKTLEGEFIGKPGDYLVEGIKGELYCCDRAIFEESYTELPDLQDDDVIGDWEHRLEF